MQDPERRSAPAVVVRAVEVTKARSVCGSGVGLASETVARSPSETLIVATGCDRASAIDGGEPTARLRIDRFWDLVVEREHASGPDDEASDGLWCHSNRVTTGGGMASAGEQYCKELARNLRYNAAWPPGIRIVLGDIGVIDDDVFMPLTSLEQFGVRLERTPASHDMAFEYASAGAVEFGFKAKGDANPTFLPNIPIDQAGLGINFTRENATVFRADGGTQQRFADETSLKVEIRSLIRAGLWDRDWHVVTDVIDATSTAALVSRSSGASVEVSVSADVSAGGLKLLTADAEAKIVASRSMQIAVIATNGLTPLFRAKRVKRRWFSSRIDLRAAYSDEFERAADDENDLFEDTPVYADEAAG